MEPIYKFTLNNKLSSNLINPDAIQIGVMVVPTTGAIAVNTSYQTTDLMPVSAGTTYHLIDTTGTVKEMMYVAFYRLNGDYISGTSGVNSVTAPNGTRFMRISFPAADSAAERSLCRLTVATWEAFVYPRIYPLYNASLAKEWEPESKQQFFREKLSGNIKLVGDDYAFIMSQAFETKFDVNLYISYDAGKTWRIYWQGHFYKTDCQIDEDSKVVTVTPSSSDRYSDLMAGMEKEFDLIKLLPQITNVKMDKRPLIQVYVPGETTIACFLSGMYWEQECEAVQETDTVEIGGVQRNALHNKYFFSLNATQFVYDVYGSGRPEVTGVYMGPEPEDEEYYEFEYGDYKLVYNLISSIYQQWEIVDKATDQPLFRYIRQYSETPPTQIQLTAVEGSGATGSVYADFTIVNVYARYLLDVSSFDGRVTHELPDDDMCPNNRNYHRVIGYQQRDVIAFSARLTSVPTQWGIYEPYRYYLPPVGAGYYPVARNAWGRVSTWFHFSAVDWQYESYGRAEFYLKDAYPLSSVISVLLREIAPELTHQPTTAYSEFLYAATNPISDVEGLTILLTQKTNLITAGYDQPAQKAPITFKAVLDLLRDCFRCYCFVDDSGRLRIEHISYFMNGGTYGQPSDDKYDLTTHINTRNGKPWAFALESYSFDKPEMASRYQFGWMDECTEPFEGFPIDIISGFVEQGKVEEVKVTKFTSDVDYILLNPSVISRDGFVLLGAVLSNYVYTLPYINFNYNGADHLLQNGYVAFMFLQGYYAYDMPAPHYSINGVSMVAEGTKRLKTHNINFPMLNDIDLMQLIKTNIGDGKISKLSVNLSSRLAAATLNYDTE